MRKYLLFIFILFLAPVLFAQNMQKIEHYYFYSGDYYNKYNSPADWLNNFNPNDWLKISSSDSPPVGINSYCWQMYKLPDIKYDSPSIFFDTHNKLVDLYGQNFEIYLENKLIFKYGKMNSTDYNQGKFTCIVPLPENYQGKKLFIRFNRYNSARGLDSPVFIGNSQALSRYMFFRNFDSTILGGFLILSSLIMIPFLFFITKENRKNFFVLIFLILFLGFFSITKGQFIYSIFPDFFTSLVFLNNIAIFVIIINIILFYNYIFGTTKYNPLNYVVYFEGFYGIFALLLRLFTYSSMLKNTSLDFQFNFEKFHDTVFYYQYNFIVLILSIYMIYTSAKIIFKNRSFEAVLFNVGLITMLVSSILDVLSYNKLFPDEYFYTPWGMFIFSFLLFYIFVYNTQNKIKQYSAELEEYNSKLLFKIEERTKDLQLKNGMLEKTLFELKESQQKIIEHEKLQAERIANENKLLLQIERERRILTEQFRESLQEMTSTLNIKDVFTILFKKLSIIINFNSAIAFLKNDSTFSPVISHGIVDKKSVQDIINNNEHKNFCFENCTKKMMCEFKELDESNGLKSYYCVPVFYRNMKIGFIILENNTNSKLDETNKEIIRTFIDQAAIAIENARLFEETSTLAKTDSLTGLFNRRYLFHLATLEFNKSMKHNHEISAMMIDIDFFKKVNDQYGHLVGDEVLVFISETIKEFFTSNAIIGRYGGEEFVVILPDTSIDNSYELAEKMRKTIESTEFISKKHHSLHLTISVGVSCISKELKSVDELLDMADKNLYIAKNNGRNKVIKNTEL